MNKLFYINPSFKIDSFFSLFNYAIYQLNHNGISKDFLDNLFDYFISNIKVKNPDPFKLNDELDEAYFLLKKQYSNDNDVYSVLSYLKGKTHQYLEKQMWLKMKQNNEL